MVTPVGAAWDGACSGAMLLEVAGWVGLVGDVWVVPLVGLEGDVWVVVVPRVGLETAGLGGAGSLEVGLVVVLAVVFGVLLLAVGAADARGGSDACLG